MSELKPCPFCGIDDLRVEENDAGGTWLCCDSCHAEGPYAPPEKNAAQAWNTRRTQPEATKPAQDLSAAILALPLPQPFDSGDGNHEDKFTESQFREFRAAAAALASPADALVAGDGEKP